MRRKAERPAHEPFRMFRDLKPHNNPDTPDSSSPKFAVCARHLKAIGKANGGRGFPALAFAPCPPKVRPPWS